MDSITICVTGGRDREDEYEIKEILKSYLGAHGETTVIHGNYGNTDLLADRCGLHWGWNVKRYNAAWEKEGKAAGPIRNALMLEHGKPDIVLAFPGKVSDWKKPGGTWDCIRKAVERGIPVEIHPIHAEVE